MKFFFDDQQGQHTVFQPDLPAGGQGVWTLKKVILGLFCLVGVGFCLTLLRDEKSSRGMKPQPESKAPVKSTSSSPSPEGSVGEFVTLDGGSYVMGDALDGLRNAQLHEVTLAAFAIGRHEVTLQLWDRVKKWARGHGYPDLPAGLGKGENHPVYAVTWQDVVKWCNARSEMEGRTPCYYDDPTWTRVLRSEWTDLTGRCVRWEADGYRLPTEAEWEIAARGGLSGMRFPWGNEISHKDANYSGSTHDIPYDKSGREGPPPAYANRLPYTAPVGSFPPNGLGLYDMAGNVYEWCWDMYDKHYGMGEQAGPQFSVMALQPSSSAAVVNPRGPEQGTSSVVRGGSWRHSAEDARCASRYDLPSSVPMAHVGFRVVRGL